ncbi:MAG TPA: hypothetical protein P5277_01305 [Candidatus Paceibacterota bacterium]|nr:hypothetical protein [Candidatus Paceibacterota bacterium]
MAKTQNNSVEYHKNILEERFRYKCRKEFPVPRNGNLHAIDLGCFHKKMITIGMEIESSKNFNIPQIQSNAEDLKEFARLFNAKTFHIHASDIIDFDKVLKPQINSIIKPRPIIRRYNG